MSSPEFGRFPVRTQVFAPTRQRRGGLAHLAGVSIEPSTPTPAQPGTATPHGAGTPDSHLDGKPTSARPADGRSGFRPGETVACCLVMGLTRAGPAGTAPVPIPPALSGTVWLVGQDSGTIEQMPRLDIE